MDEAGIPARSASGLVWAAAGRPAPEGKTGATYRLEAAAGLCATCAAPIAEGVPVMPRRGVAGIDNETFHGHAEYFRFGTHVCAACAWLYGDPKRTHRSVVAIGGSLWWPKLGPAAEGRPRWRTVLADLAGCGHTAPGTLVAGVLTTDPKPRLWPRMTLSMAAAPELYVHSPDHDWSRPTAIDPDAVRAALFLVDEALASGASRRACWHGLLGSQKLVDAAGLDRLLQIDAALAPLRGGPTLLAACLVA